MYVSLNVYVNINIIVYVSLLNIYIYYNHNILNVQIHKISPRQDIKIEILRQSSIY